MAPELKWRRRIEAGLRVVGPLLDLMLAGIDRASRVLEHDDPDYVPARMAHEGESAPRGLASLPPRRGA
jgi:hypothetical protein